MGGVLVDEKRIVSLLYQDIGPVRALPPCATEEAEAWGAPAAPAPEQAPA